MSDDYSIVVKRFDVQDPRLGRHVVHDSRSRRYAAPRKDPRTLKSARHTVNIPVLQQDNEGSCTGHWGSANMAAGAFWVAAEKVLPVDAEQAHQWARHLYMDATLIDPWPGSYLPEDTGSDGLSIAKVLQARGLVSGYQHAFSLEAALTALAKQVVGIGSDWLSGMYDPDPSTGRITVDGTVEGGHQYALDEIDVENRRAWIRNSWGPSWGQAGRAWMTWDDLGKLLANQGDCTVLIPLSLPPPTPTPEPVPIQPTDPQAARELAAALRKFAPTKGCPLYLKQAATAWLKENP